MAVLQPGSRVRLDCPDPAFEGIDPLPVDIGAEGTVLRVVGAMARVAWDAGWETCVPLSYLERRQR